MWCIGNTVPVLVLVCVLALQGCWYGEGCWYWCVGSGGAGFGNRCQYWDVVGIGDVGI